MTKICTLFSGSSGNSTFISNNSTRFLVDAGGSCKSICDKLLCINEDIKNINGIVLTHEHIDHIKALKVLSKRFGIPIFAKTEILEFLSDNDLVHPNTKLVEIDTDFVLGEFNVHTFPTNHDSLSSIGFVFDNGDCGKIGFATDLGEYSQEVKESLIGCKTVVLESNYDESMLSCGSYPYMLKRRIMS
ncbi:MAG: MBL fold metallo-hydrolase, partial [Oscillospiraceae bacterium]